MPQKKKLWDIAHIALLQITGSVVTIILISLEH